LLLDPVAVGNVTAASDAASDPLTWLFNVGVAGVVLVLLVTGQLRTKSEVTQLERQIVAKDEALAALQAQLTANTLPALERSALVIEALPLAAQRHQRGVYGDLNTMRQELAHLSEQLRHLTTEEEH
jgi:hypothetical protein